MLRHTYQMSEISGGMQPATGGVRAEFMLWPVEGLRGLAAFMVMWWHLRHWVSSERGVDAFGYTGVDLFFVLSGFVFAPYVFGRPLALRAFALRRMLRIYPSYLVSLVLYMLLRHAQGADPWLYAWQHALLLHTSFSQEIAAYYNGAYWSLPVELEFYVLVPVLAWVVRRRRWGFGMVLVFALFLHQALSLWVMPGQSPLPWVLALVHWPGLWAEFLLGCLAWRMSRLPRLRRWVPAMCGVSALWWLAGAMVWITLGDAGVMAHPMLRGNMGYWAALSYALLVCAVGACSAAAGATSEGGWSGWARVSMLGGQLSYGVYLLHNAGQELSGLLWPGLGGWPRVMASAVLTMVAAWCLHHAVEAPARTWGRRI